MANTFRALSEYSIQQINNRLGSVYINGTEITTANRTTINNYCNSSGNDILTVTAKTGKIFTDYGYVAIDNGDYVFLIQSAENSGLTYTFTIPVNDDVIKLGHWANTQPDTATIQGVSQQIYFYKIADYVGFTYTASYSLSHCTSNINDTTLNGNQSYNFTLTAENGYKFSGAPVVTLSDSTPITVTKVSDYSYTFTLNVTDSNITGVSISASAILETVSFSFNNVLENCSVSPVLTSVEQGTTYNITVSANNGYIFDIVPSLVYLDENGDFITVSGVKVSNYQYTFSFTVGNDLTQNYSYYRLTASANIETETTTKYGVLQIHKVTNENLKQINNLKYYNGSLSQVDLSNYISSLKLLPVNVATEKNDNIYLSNINTGISAPVIENDYIIVQLGAVTLTGYYQNELDKKYSKIKLVLPYIDVVSIESELMNETIKIDYKINIVTGDATVFIYLVKNSVDYLFKTVSGNIGVDVPYLVTIENENKIVQGYSNKNTLIEKPKVIIETQLKATNNTIYDCYKKSLISSETGYFKCSHIDIDSNTIPLNEIEMIKNKLLKGVYI